MQKKSLQRSARAVLSSGSCLMIAAILLCCSCAPAGRVNPRTGALYLGQPDRDVRKVMGQPSIEMQSASNRFIWVYGELQLEFTNGRLSAPGAEELAKIEPRRTKHNTTTVAPGRLKSWLTSLNAWAKQTFGSSEPLTVVNSQGETIDHHDLLVSGKVTVLFFFIPGNDACTKVESALAIWIKSRPGVVLKKISIEFAHSSLSRQYNVAYVPNIRVFDRQGRLVAPPTYDKERTIKAIQRARAQP